MVSFIHARADSRTVHLWQNSSLAAAKKRPGLKIAVGINKAIFCQVNGWHLGYLLWGCERGGVGCGNMLVDILACLPNLSERFDHIKQLLQCWQEMSGSKRGWNKKNRSASGGCLWSSLGGHLHPHTLTQLLFHPHPLEKKKKITSRTFKWTLVTPRHMEAIIKAPQLRKKYVCG